MNAMLWRIVEGALSALCLSGLALLPAQEKPAVPGRAVATVDSGVITAEELSAAVAAQLEKLEMQHLQAEAAYRSNRQQAVESALARLVEGRLLEAEAKRLGVGTTELLAQEVENKVQDPTPDEVNAFYESNKARIPTPKAQVLPQLVRYLRQQTAAKLRAQYFDRLKQQHHVSISIEPLRFDVESAGHPSKGKPNSPVVMVEFSDFKCTFCRGFNSTIERILKDYGDDVRLVYRQFPLAEIHPEAPKASEASLCADEQGKFWEMHDSLFQHQDKMSVPDLKASAATLGLDTAAFNSCLDSGKYAGKIREDIRDAVRAGVSGTPATFINGRFVSGARSYEDVAAIINDELKRKGGAGAARP